MSRIARTPLLVFDEGSGGSVFRAYRPAPSLAGAVELVWMTSGVPRVRRSRVLPNGVLELIVNLGGRQKVVRERGHLSFREAWVAGLQRGPLDIGSDEDSHLVGIRFRPGGAAGVLGLPVGELTDHVVEWRGRHAWVATLRERLFAARSDDERVDVVEATLARLAPAPPDGRVALALAAMARAPAGLSVARLAAELGCSHKHLIDRFHRDVGLSPKTLQRILRFQAVLRAVDAGAPVSWTELAHAHGYADQAHMIHDFRALAGVSPGGYLRTRTVDPNHLDAGG